MSTKPALGRCRTTVTEVRHPCHLDIPFAPEFEPVRCHPPTRSLLATFEGQVIIAFRHGDSGLFRSFSADEARHWAADLLRAADSIDQGKGKQ